ncbi:diacylglycerol kinase, partial [Pseudoalteromonas ruthenica]
IITRNSNYHAEGIEVVTSADAALKLAAGSEEVMIIGGGLVYEQFLPLCERLYLTFINLHVDGDTCFPDYEKVSDWTIVDTQSHEPNEKNKCSYKFVTLQKKL